MTSRSLKLETRSSYHKPVMLKECLEALHIKPEGIYVDATFGGGGHSLAILEKIKGGKLIAFDQDEDAQQEAKKLSHRSFTFCLANFKHLKRYLRQQEITKVDGILADLGISSHQIDTPQRGFSTRFDGPLDMRMDRNMPVTAAKILNEYSEDQLHRLLGEFGEVKNAKTAARLIVQHRVTKKYTSNNDLLDVLQQLAPRGKESKYKAQVFQALRIEANEEMKALESFLNQCTEVILTGGRLVVMSYHSLEDRMVKNFMSTGKVFGELEKDFYGNPLRPFRALSRKPIIPGEKEIKENSRARSAKLRVAEKLETTK